MHELAAKFALPPFIEKHLTSGQLCVIQAKESEMTIEFGIPSLRTVDLDGRITTYSLVWIHPDCNRDFCHYYLETPGDLPNFYVESETTDVGSDVIDNLDSLDQLEAWLESRVEAVTI